MSKVARAAERFRRSMAAASAKSVPAAPSMPAGVVSAFSAYCAECHIPLRPGEEVYTAESGFPGVRVICHECKAILDDAIDTIDDEDE